MFFLFPTEDPIGFTTTPKDSSKNNNYQSNYILFYFLLHLAPEEIELIQIKHMHMHHKSSISLNEF